MTVPEVVIRAGCSTGAFYARFRGREALLRHLESLLYEEATDHWVVSLVRARRGHAPGLQVDDVVRGTVAMYRRNAPLLRALAVRSRLLRLDTRLVELDRLHREDVFPYWAAAIQRAGEIAHPRPWTALRTSLEMVRGMVAERVLFHPQPVTRNEMRLADRRLVTELSRLVKAYLGVEAIGRSTQTPYFE